MNKYFKHTKQIFDNKSNQYGTNWIYYHPNTLTDLLFIKALRLITIDNNKGKMVNEPLSEDIMSIINYSIMRIMKLDYKIIDSVNLDECYAVITNDCLDLMKAKNTDYGDAWKFMRYRTILDLIMGKIRRIIQMELNSDNEYLDDIKSNLQDIINYAIFLLNKTDKHEI